MKTWLMKMITTLVSIQLNLTTQRPTILATISAPSLKANLKRFNRHRATKISGKIRLGKANINFRGLSNSKKTVGNCKTMKMALKMALRMIIRMALEMVLKMVLEMALKIKRKITLKMGRKMAP